MKLAEKIVYLRKQKGLSQEELAGKLQVSRQAVSRWENGSAQPDAANILQLSKLFGVSADYLLNEDCRELPSQPKPGASPKRKIGLWIAAGGVLGNFSIYILSRMVKVMVPHITYDGLGRKWYNWSSEIKGYSYKYFIQAHDLELLCALFYLLFLGGLALAFINKEKIGTWIRTGKERHNKKRKP